MRRFLTIAVLAATLAAAAGCSTTPPPASDQVQKYYDANKDLKTSAPAATAVVVSVLSDSHAFNADSWWRQTVVANKVPGLALGAFESQPGAASSSLVARLDAATAKKGLVIVQAGTNDLLSRQTPADAAAGVEALWKGVKDRGATPVAALVPPSDKVPAEVVELNNLLTAAATSQGLKIIDVYHAVAGPDGTWLAGDTIDGTHANKAGSDLMTAAAKKQLPSLAG